MNCMSNVNVIILDGPHVQATLRRPALSGSWWKGLYGEHGPCRELFLVRMWQIVRYKLVTLLKSAVAV